MQDFDVSHFKPGQKVFFFTYLRSNNLGLINIDVCRYKNGLVISDLFFIILFYLFIVSKLRLLLSNQVFGDFFD